MFGGGEQINLSPMLREVNQAGVGSYWELEKQWRTLIAQVPPVDISVRMEPNTWGPAESPNASLIEWAEDGIPEEQVFENVAR
ncbi:hypothetical protein ACVW07_002532 [Cellulomonas sp. URHB0016]